jgi:hypothetical protein
MLGHKSNFNKYKKIEIILCILSDHSAIKLELNNKRSSRKYSNNWKWTIPFFMISGSLNKQGKK